MSAPRRSSAAPPAGPPTPAEVKQGKRLARRMRGRPKLGNGTRVVSVSVEVDLLRRADAYALQTGVKRAELFSRGLQAVLPGH